MIEIFFDFFLKPMYIYIVYLLLIKSKGFIMNNRIILSLMLLASCVTISPATKTAAIPESKNTSKSSRFTQITEQSSNQIIVTFNEADVAAGLKISQEAGKEFENYIKSNYTNFQKQRTDLDNRKKELEKKGDTLKQEAMTQEIQEIIAGEQSLQEQQQRFQMEAQQKSIEVQTEIKKAIDEAVKKVITENPNFIVIPVGYTANENFDVTQEIIKNGNAHYEAKKAPKKADVKK
jgi:Skp family chaperone for outer membrane proteins